MEKVSKSNNLHYTVIQIYLTREIVAKRLHLITWTKFDLVKLHNQINQSSLYHFLGLTFNSCLFLNQFVCRHRVSAMPPIESVLVCREAIHIRVLGFSNHYTLHCETQSVVLVLLVNGPHGLYTATGKLKSSVVSIQRLLSLVSYVTTKYCDSQSQVLELSVQFLQFLFDTWMVALGLYFLRLVGVAAWLFWVTAQVLIHTMLLGFLCSCLWLPAVDTGLP